VGFVACQGPLAVVQFSLTPPKHLQNGVAGPQRGRRREPVEVVYTNEVAVGDELQLPKYLPVDRCRISRQSTRNSSTSGGAAGSSSADSRRDHYSNDRAQSSRMAPAGNRVHRFANAQ
jgi:hypothetical protein